FIYWIEYYDAKKSHQDRKPVPLRTGLYKTASLQGDGRSCLGEPGQPRLRMANPAARRLRWLFSWSLRPVRQHDGWRAPLHDPSPHVAIEYDRRSRSGCPEGRQEAAASFGPGAAQLGAIALSDDSQQGRGWIPQDYVGRSNATRGTGNDRARSEPFCA